jgi:glycosyltransferase involved in cell wall biosynthesis
MSYYSGNNRNRNTQDEQMIIEAVIVCKNFSDILAYTLAHTLDLLDRVVVVTHHDDKDTARLCQKLSVDCIKTTIFHEDGDKFNKGRAINLGLSHLRHSDWLLHIDADIMLPPRFRTMLMMAKLDQRYLYGCDRFNTCTYDKWMKAQEKIYPQYAYRYLVRPVEELPLGARLVHLEYGYCPIGFFQLWHSSTNRQYPIICGSAEHSDVLFAVQWERSRRVLLPEFFVYHLQAENAKFGADWKGRQTKTFGPNTKGSRTINRVDLAGGER